MKHFKFLKFISLFFILVPLSFPITGIALSEEGISSLDNPTSGSFSEQVLIPANQYYLYNNTWNETQRVFVSYQGISGGYKDVIVHVVDLVNLNLFKTDKSFVPIISYQKLAQNTFEFNATANITYFIIFSNQFSFISEKTIQINVYWVPINTISSFQSKSTFQLIPKTRYIMEFEYFTNTSISLNVNQGGPQGVNTMDIYIVDISNLINFLQNNSYEMVYRRKGFTLIDEEIRLDESGTYFLIIQASIENSADLMISCEIDFPIESSPFDDMWIGTIPIIVIVIVIFGAIIANYLRNKQLNKENKNHSQKYQALSKASMVTNKPKENASSSKSLEQTRFTPKESPDDEPKFCPYCGSEISLTLKVCPFCKTKLE